MTHSGPCSTPTPPPAEPDSANTTTTTLGVAQPAAGSGGDTFVGNVPLSFLCRTPAGVEEGRDRRSGSSLTLSQIRALCSDPTHTATGGSTRSLPAALDSPWTWNDVCESARFQSTFPRSMQQLHHEEEDEEGCSSGEGSERRRSKPARPRHRLHPTPRSRPETRGDLTMHAQPVTPHAEEQCASKRTMPHANHSPTDDPAVPAPVSSGESSCRAARPPVMQQVTDTLPWSSVRQRRRCKASGQAKQHGGAVLNAGSTYGHSTSSSHLHLDSQDTGSEPAAASHHDHSSPAAFRPAGSDPADKQGLFPGSRHTSSTSKHYSVEDDVLRSSSASAVRSDLWLSPTTDCPAEKEFSRLKERLDRATTRLANSFDPQMDSESTLSISDMMGGPQDYDISVPSIGKGNVVFMYWQQVPFG
ncbi:MAG: hypothetical protein WDW36_000746 [Sanguina aurantia]